MTMDNLNAVRALQRAHLVELIAAASLKGALALARFVLSVSGLSAKNARTSLRALFLVAFLASQGQVRDPVRSPVGFRDDTLDL